MIAAGPAAELPLRDIHLPAPPALPWWPPAPGWWLLGALLIVIAGLIYLLRKMRRQRRWRTAALAELTRIENTFSRTRNREQLLRELSTLLRRVAISRFPHTDCAALTGAHWLRFLDQTTELDGFSSGAGQVLATGPYRPANGADCEAADLLALCRDWLCKLPARKVCR
ncbi:MAG: DUF4381 domain-containing protein [Desulfuromonadales bacterium]|nr:DUF4381 domain-containing protein [Desulfuromonadales bacterium]